MTDADAERRLAAARASIAGAEPTGDEEPESLGDIRLRRAQRGTAMRLRRLLARHGGALLADPVGTGKTYVALAVARHFSDVVIVAPAALRDMWTGALGSARLAARLLSYERLSRDPRVTDPIVPGLVILDEAHHARNASTRRYASIVALCRDAPVLLLSATPVQNRLVDLVAQLALFLGARAPAMNPVALARLVVRAPGDAADESGATGAPYLPQLDGPHRVALAVVDDCLDLLLGLPPPTPAADGGDGGALLAYSLVRQWESSRGALVGALRRRLARAVALGAALESGRRPTRAELAAWTYADNAVQLAFPELLAGATTDAAALLGAVRAQEDALRTALRDVVSSPDPDGARAAALRRIRAAHRGERIIAFSEFAETVRALGQVLAGDGGVACLTARGARIAGGSMSRREVLAQFVPGTGGAASRSDHIDLLLTTDVLSEGLNLQQASVVVHIDLPWNPARLEQRVGRVRRIGSVHRVVTVYALTPPADAERLLQVERRLAAKLDIARRSIGAGHGVLPPPLALTARSSAAGDTTDGEAEEMGCIHRILARWRIATMNAARRAAPEEPTVVAAVRADVAGFVALLDAADDSGDPLIVADLGDGPTTRPGVVRRALEAMERPAAAIAAGDLAAARRALDAWWSARRATRAVDPGAAASARARRLALERLENIRCRSPRHRRVATAALAASARAVLGAPLSAGAERAIAKLASAPLDDDAWLRAVVAFGATRAGQPVRRDPDNPPIVTLVLLREPSPSIHGYIV